MFKFCPKCGYKLVQEYKFCPECGFELEKNKEDEIPVNNDLIGTAENSGPFEKIICENCGEENDIGNIVCSGCGVKFANAKIVSAANIPSSTKSAGTQQNKPKPDYKKPINKNTSSVTKKAVEAGGKKLSRKNTLIIIAAAVGVALVILFFSGMLNFIFAPGGDTAKNQPAPANQNSGIDLNSLKKINDLDAVIKNNPHDTTSILELAHLKNDAGMYEQAIVNYKQYLEMVPRDADARIDMGICYYNLQNFDAAISQMELAIKYDSKHQIGYLNLGIVNLSAGNFEKSQEWLKKAVELDPNSEYGKKAQELLSSHNNKTNGGK